MYRILSTLSNIPIEKVKGEFEKFEIDVQDEMKREEIMEIIHRYDGIIAADIIEYDEEIFEKAEKLKVISRYGVGVDNVDIEAAKKHGVTVTNAPGENAESVAEHTIGLMIAAAKNFSLADRKIRKGNWKRSHGFGKELAGKVLGQVGFGNIGKLVAQKCKLAFDMNVLVYDPYVPEYKVRNLISGKKEELPELLRKSDVVSLNIPATEETKDLFDYEKFKIMKDESIFVNTGRGEVVVEEDLARALDEGRIFAAGLDVLRNEPVKEDNPLLRKENTVITPHSASTTPESNERVLRAVLRDQKSVFEGKTPVGIQKAQMEG
ncbi:MAG: hydroxyacid dehydrogenase [Candidatus Hadarchaeia archaeon]